MGKKLLLALLLALATAASALAAMSLKNVTPEKAEQLCRRFIEKRLMNADGGIYTFSKTRNWFLFRSYNQEDLKYSGILSESTGLLMNYAVAADDRLLFDSQLSYAKRFLVGQLGLFYWKVSYDGELAASTTASIDDLRIVGACLDAYERWNIKKYLKFAIDIAWNIQEYEIVNDQMHDYVSWRDWGDRVVAPSVQLSYIDLDALKKLAKYEESWKPIYEANEKIMKKGELENGLYYEKYDFDSKVFSGTTQNTINQLYCGLFAAQSGDGCPKIMDFFKDRLREDGVIYAEYDASSGDATKFFESTSVYALFSRLARRCGDGALADSMVQRLMKFQNRNVISPLYGSFSDDEIYSFDNLEALLALREYNAAAGKASPHGNM